jgi:predicted helicase
LGARKTENVFNIQTPVAIAVGVRNGKPKPDKPAKVHYTKIEGTRAAKFQKLLEIQKLADLKWQPCASDWQAPFLPEGSGDYNAWPLLTDLFPLQFSGPQYKRKWPIGESRDLLKKRWGVFIAASQRKRKELFYETRDRKIDIKYSPLNKVTERNNSSIERTILSTVTSNDPTPNMVRYRYRSFDRQWAFLDNRIGDYLRSKLWSAHSSDQIYLTSFLTGVLGLGPAAIITSEVPDMDHFRGSFGGKHVIPLWRDAEATQPNITAGLLDMLSKTFEQEVTAEDLFAYAYGILSSPSYVEKFSEELTIPGPRLPITKDANLFNDVANLGSELIYLHTYGEKNSALLLCSKAEVLFLEVKPAIP